jgi:predicted GNAT family acetyltransferase
MSKPCKEVVVNNNETSSRFEAQVAGRSAFIEYRRASKEITFLHSYVPASLEGYGIGGQLARAGLEFARTTGLKIFALCPFVRSYILRHSAYSDLVESASPSDIA